MFCTHCGTQVDEGKNFCRNCGARIGKASEAAPVNPPPMEPTATSTKEQQPVAAAQPATVPHARERRGVGAAAIVGGCVVFIVAAGAGIYFGTDLLRPSTKPEPPQTVAQAPAPTAPRASDTPADAPWKETKNPADGGAASAPQVQSERSPAEPANPPPDSSSKSTPRPDVPAAQRPQDVPPPARASKPAEPAPGSRRGGAGIYETVRPTNVFQAPAPGSQVVANIPSGTRVNVVGSSGEWLEVHSRRGNPPGFIRRDDATFVSKGE